MAAVTICSDFGAPQNKVSLFQALCIRADKDFFSHWALSVFPKELKEQIFPSICYEVIETDAMILIFWMLSFKPAFSLSSLTFIKRLFILFFFQVFILFYFIFIFIFFIYFFNFILFLNFT